MTEPATWRTIVLAIAQTIACSMGATASPLIAGIDVLPPRHVLQAFNFKQGVETTEPKSTDSPSAMCCSQERNSGLKIDSLTTNYAWRETPRTSATLNTIASASPTSSDGPREKEAYLGQLNELRPFLNDATIDLLKAKGAPRFVLSETEKGILETLTAMLPHSAASYEQALRDMSQGGRISWRGTATELREVLREVMDHLAPDDKVSVSPGFRLEPGLSGTTCSN